MKELTPEALCSEMEQAYFDETGFPVDSASDVGLRFRILAGELYSLARQGDFILKQAFPQTAQGEYLEKQAAARGLYRKRASPAIGRLCFSVEEPAKQDIEIPVGTVCAPRERPYLRYATVGKGVIPAGSYLGEAAARSLGDGSAYNMGPGLVDMMVTPPAGVAQVRNPRAFQGGSEAEDDVHFRSRLLEFMRFRPNGFDRESYISRIIDLEAVLDANAYQNAQGALTVAVRTRSGTLDSALKDEIKVLLTECLLIPTELEITAAKARAIPLTVVVMPAGGHSGEEAAADVKALIEKDYSLLRIGETFYPQRLGQKISELVSVGDFVIESGLAPVTAKADEYLTTASKEVTVDAW